MEKNVFFISLFQYLSANLEGAMVAALDARVTRRGKHTTRLTLYCTDFRGKGNFWSFELREDATCNCIRFWRMTKIEECRANSRSVDQICIAIDLRKSRSWTEIDVGRMGAPSQF